MNRRQKALLRETVVVLSVTVAVLIGMLNLKDWINRREAMRAMHQLAESIQDYRTTYQSVPARDFVDAQIPTLSGHVRLGKLTYRAAEITLDSADDEILAYTEQHYRSLFVNSGYIVMHLDGTVLWREQGEFQAE
ncbi:MAG: hypothetical protein IIC50_03765 [Planctomycetes bacterium]|nr:hypothetical protein [Planctomycetota bacterium]